MTTLTSKTAITKDQFASSEYNDPNAKLPTLQALRGEKGDIDCGYFITVAEMEKAGWYNINAKDLTTYEFHSGSQEQGLLIKSPRMLVVPRSPLFAFDRQISLKEKRMLIVGAYSRQLHSEREKYGLGQYYEVLLLNQNNEPLHETSCAYLAKGANQASFNTHWQQLVNEVTRCHAIANQIPARPKNALFNSLCVFQFTVQRELAGNSLKSYACKVNSHVSPTQDNWESFFLGRNSATADRFLNLMAPTTELNLSAVQSQSLALPSADSEIDDGVADAQLVHELPSKTIGKLEPAPLTSPELEGLKRSLSEKADMLGWTPKERKDWAFERHGCNSSGWTPEQWQEANDDLQDKIEEAINRSKLVLQ
jgi:hypothetical protein